MSRQGPVRASGAIGSPKAAGGVLVFVSTLIRVAGPNSLTGYHEADIDFCVCGWLRRCDRGGRQVSNNPSARKVGCTVSVWRVSRHGKVRGPFTEPEMFELIGRAKVGRGDYVSLDTGTGSRSKTRRHLALCCRRLRCRTFSRLQRLLTLRRPINILIRQLSFRILEPVHIAER